MANHHGIIRAALFPQASARLRQALYRATLEWLLEVLYLRIESLSDEQFAALVRDLEQNVLALEPAWAWPPHPSMPQAMPALREQVAEAFRLLHTATTIVARRDGTGTIPVGVGVSLTIEGPRGLRLGGTLRDGLVWVGFRLLAEVPRSLIRRCELGECGRPFCGGRNQRYCLEHRAEAQRQTQRRAERAFRARAKKRKRRT